MNNSPKTTVFFVVNQLHNVLKPYPLRSPYAVTIILYNLSETSIYSFYGGFFFTFQFLCTFELVVLLRTWKYIF